MYRGESWAIKKAEHQRTDAFILWGWRRLLRVPWTERRSNQSIQKEINLEYSLQGLVLKKALESPLDSKEIKPVNPKGNQPWIFIGRTDVEAETPILWPPDVKSQLIGKDPDAGKDWGKQKRGSRDEMVREHHWLSGHEPEQTLGDSEGQGSLVCCSPWGCQESDTT